MKRLLTSILGLVCLTIPAWAATDGKFSYSYPEKDKLPYNLGYQYSVYDLKESDTEGWRVMYLEKPLTLVYHITSEADKTAEVVFDPAYLELEDILIPDTAVDPDTGIEYTVTAIGKMAFDDCPKIRSVIMGDSITRIEDYAFNMCDNKVLHNIGFIRFSENLKHIGNFAFKNCHNLTTGYYKEGDQWPLTVRNFLRNVDYPVYGYGARLTGLDDYLLLPASVEYIGKHAFEGCCFEINHLSYGLCKVKIPNPSCVIDDYAFAGCKFLELITIGGDLNYDGLKYTPSDTSPKGRIGDYAFANCNLMRLDIPSSIESIGEGAFSNCFKRESANTPIADTGRIYFDDLNWFYPRSLFNNEDDWWHSWNFTNPENFDEDYKIRCDNLLKRWHTNTVTLHSDRTDIGINAFADNPQLEKVFISGSAGKIGSEAFRNCTNLKEIELPDHLSAISSGLFKNCSALTAINIPGSVTEIGDSAFYMCIYLKNIDLPSNLERVNPYTFYGCERIDISALPERITSIGDYAFYGCRSIESLTIPGSVESIGDYAFAQCFEHGYMRVDGGHKFLTGLLNVKIGDKVRSIGAHAFDGCRHLGQIEFGSSVEEIGDYAFLNCMSCPEDDSSNSYEAADLILPESLTTIGIGAFQGCTDLPSASLGARITQLPEYAFAYCTELYSVEGLSHVDSTARTTFAGCYNLEDFSELYDEESGLAEDGMFYNEDGTEIISALPNIMEAIIPEGVTRIHEGAFAECGMLGYVEFPESLEEIGSRAFENCISLPYAELFNVKMGDFVYAGCTGIMEVIINSDFDQDINDNWFAGCYNMEAILVIDNKRYDSYGDVFLTDKGGTTLLRAPSGIVDVEIPEECTAIGDYAFSNCIKLEEVVIPSTVKSIGAHAFENCYQLTHYASWDSETGLRSIVFENPAVSIGEYAFNGCKLLSGILWDVEPVDEDTWDGEPGSIGAFAFNDCEELKLSSDELVSAAIGTLEPYAFANFPGITDIILPSTLRSIGDHAFENCQNLSSVVFPKKLKTIGQSAFRSTPITFLDLPDSIEEIGDSAFMDCSKVMALKLPANLKKISPYTFYKCFSGAQFDTKPEEHFNLSVDIPDNVESIGDYAFYGCTTNSNKFYAEHKHSYSSIFHFYNFGLSSLSLGERLTTIGAHAFDGCTYLMEVKMGNAVSSIGAYAFKDCFNNNLNCVREGEFTLSGYTIGQLENYPIVWQMDENVAQPVSLPEALTSLEEGAFSGCTQLPSINFPASMTTIPDRAFNGCAKFTRIDLPEGITTIGDGAFYGCKDVMEISISESLTKGSRMFAECDSAFNVTYLAAQPESFDEGMFSSRVYSSKKSVVKAPNALLEDIKGKTPWALFYKIEAKDDTLVHLERVLEEKNGLRFRVLSNKPVPYCEVAGPAVQATDTISYIVPEYVKNIDEESPYYGLSYKVIRIGNDAFEDDLTLVGIHIPESVYDIGQEAFSGCKNLPEINLPQSITNMGERAFANCYSLTFFEVPPLVTRLNPEVLKDCRGLYSIRMHDNIQELCMGSLMDCRHLRAFERSENWKLRLIDDYALKNCIELETINIPEGVEKIGREAMYYCQKLQIASLPKSLQEIGENAFDDCEVLSTIKVYTEKIPKMLGEGNLTEPHCKIFVQAKCLDAYRDLWNVHAHRIEPGISVTQPTRAEMPVYVPGSTFTFASIMPLDGQIMTWKAFNNVVATPDPAHDGTVHINAVGPTHIKVETDQHYYHDCDLDVYPQLADANWDGRLDISDAVNIANYAIQNPGVLINWWQTNRTDFDSETEWNRFYYTGADVNKDDDISVSDASAAVKIILNAPAQQSSAHHAPRKASADNPGDALVIGLTPAVSRGIATFPVSLDNSVEYVALQADITVPAGFTLKDVTAGRRAAGHTFRTRRIDDRTIRVVIYDLNNSVFAVSSEPLFNVMVGGDNVSARDIEISAAYASDKASQSFALDTRNGWITNHVGSVSNPDFSVSSTAEGVMIANAAGKKVIICSEDGKVIRSFTAGSDTETLSLHKGIYIISVEGSAIKILVE